ncbi:hypothetical protein K435DRAFT_780173 [Dendrothele bispora CBS 962.96]|uniref:Uncharacterized protein n=1 Tax=Dendrothele bispora (strain CBS 962.96) TaxID=1314807 RepID=A0A4V4HEV3_DENBC|nr:hypothetical protein K435DRAFT_780173 [Dendrothele bispora CBS 962.96]
MLLISNHGFTRDSLILVEALVHVEKETEPVCIARYSGFLDDDPDCRSSRVIGC